MISPGDATPSVPCDAQPEDLDVAVVIDRFETVAALDVKRVSHTWAGLRTFAPDESPILGFDPRAKDFFWFAGQGGFGVQTAPGFAQLADNQLTGRTFTGDYRPLEALKSELAYQVDKRVRVHAQNLEEFLSHGLRYLVIPERGAISRGMATLTSAPPFAALFVAGENPIVWPDSSGDVRGESFSPIYKSAPSAARRDPELYELLVIADALRAGRAREKQATVKALKKKLQNYG